MYKMSQLSCREAVKGTKYTFVLSKEKSEMHKIVFTLKKIGDKYNPFTGALKMVRDR